MRALCAWAGALGAAFLVAVSGPASGRVSGDPSGCGSVRLAAPLPVGTTPCPGVRPGALLQIPVGEQGQIESCTFNFLFRGGGDRYIATAGHCILDQEGERAWMAGTGPPAEALVDGEQRAIGRFVYAVLNDEKDFALILVDDRVKTRAQMCHFGGPTGINGDRTSTPTPLHHYGNGVLLVTVGPLPARSAVAIGMEDSAQLFAFGAAYPVDSGSPVITSDGRAVGALVALCLGASCDPEFSPSSPRPSSLGRLVITRLGPQVRRAERVLDVDLSIQTAPLLP